MHLRSLWHARVWPAPRADEKGLHNAAQERPPCTEKVRCCGPVSRRCRWIATAHRIESRGLLCRSTARLFPLARASAFECASAGRCTSTCHVTHRATRLSTPRNGWAEHADERRVEVNVAHGNSAAGRRRGQVQGDRKDEFKEAREDDDLKRLARWCDLFPPCGVGALTARSAARGLPRSRLERRISAFECRKSLFDYRRSPARTPPITGANAADHRRESRTSPFEP